MRIITILLCLVVSSDAAAQCGNYACRMCYPRAMPVYRAYLEPAKPDFVPTPRPAVAAMLHALQLAPSDVLYDLGCGDARILIAAAELYGCQAVGIEINPANATLARQEVAKSSAASRIRIVDGDATKFDLSRATVATMYLPPKLVAELVPKLTTARAIASYQHDILCRPTVRVGKRIYVWRR